MTNITATNGGAAIATTGGDITSGANVQAHGAMWTGIGGAAPTAPHGDAGDITADGALYADANVTSWSGSIQARSSGQTTTKPVEIGDGDIYAYDNVLAGGDFWTSGTRLLFGNYTNEHPGEVASFDSLLFHKDLNNNDPLESGVWFQWMDDDNHEVMRLNDDADDNDPTQSDADLLVEGSFISNGVDLAEYYPTLDSQALKPGTVVAVDGAHSEHVVTAQRGTAEAVLGVVSTAPGVVLGGQVQGQRPDLLEAANAALATGKTALGKQLRQQWTATESARTDRTPVALSGRVPVLVDGSGGAIHAGDRLGLGNVLGHAARYAGVGPVVGIAMQDWNGSSPSIVAFVRAEHDGGSATANSAATAPPAAAPSGSAVLPAGATSAVVRAPGASSASLPMITFLGDPGSRSWVSQRGEGFFTVTLASPAPADVGFAWQIVP